MVRIHLATGHVVNTIESFEWVLNTVEVHRGGGYFSVRKKDRTMVAIACQEIILVEQVAAEPEVKPNMDQTPHPGTSTPPVIDAQVGQVGGLRAVG